jgi:hypothetical protein
MQYRCQVLEGLPPLLPAELTSEPARILITASFVVDRNDESNADNSDRSTLDASRCSTLGEIWGAGPIAQLAQVPDLMPARGLGPNSMVYCVARLLDRRERSLAVDLRPIAHDGCTAEVGSQIQACTDNFTRRTPHLIVPTSSELHPNVSSLGNVAQTSRRPRADHSSLSPQLQQRFRTCIASDMTKLDEIIAHLRGPWALGP